MSTEFSRLLTIGVAPTAVQLGDVRLSVASSVNPLGAVGQMRVILPGLVRKLSSAGGVLTRRKYFCGPVMATCTKHQPFEMTGTIPAGDHFFRSTLDSSR